MLSTLYGTYFSFLIHFKMSAVCLNLDQSKILLSSNGLNKSLGQGPSMQYVQAGSIFAGALSPFPWDINPLSTLYVCLHAAMRFEISFFINQYQIHFYSQISLSGLLGHLSFYAVEYFLV